MYFNIKNSFLLSLASDVSCSVDQQLSDIVHSVAGRWVGVPHVHLLAALAPTL